ncbi:YpiB family protein [Ammoniphilus sp. CFH 90114]|uniref:YpiB family protein n=1 Tax=Ammoniphilus sp. CFH 90114 TaxID=2493665 RepID=UPI00100EB902|nr:YpiB family protein [Ammoniphilus sp. CFH 90114]RXT13928.1 IDEAL domain-containing protein [Ammoniphilus sp. CFH 90114]
MGEAVTVSAKKEFIRWFLSKFQLKKKEGSWLFNYMLSDERLLERVHFTDDLRNRDKTMIISTVCSQATPFQFQKSTKIYYDVERAFHDIRLNPEEDVFISLYFKDRLLCPQYLAVLEGRPMESPRITQDDVMSLMAEIVMDKAIRKQRLKVLYDEIDRSLAEGNQSRFLELTGEWNELRKMDFELES